jgi:hypothetical protein
VAVAFIAQPLLVLEAQELVGKEMLVALAT